MAPLRYSAAHDAHFRVYRTLMISNLPGNLDARYYDEYIRCCTGLVGVVMYRAILVPLNGSTFAERALPYAHRLAQASGARLLLIRALERPAAAQAALDPAHTLAVREAGRYLGGVAGRLSATYPIESAVVTEALAPAIVKEVGRRTVDLVVIALAPRDTGDESPYCSTLAQVVREARVPLVLIPTACRRPWRAGSRPRIVVPLDGTAAAERALAPAGTLANVLSGELLLLYVHNRRAQAHRSSLPDEALAEVTDSEAAARSYPASLARSLADAGRQAEWRVVYGDLVAAVAEAAREPEVGAIATVTSHGPGVSDVRLHAMLRAVEVPLVIVGAEPTVG